MSKSFGPAAEQQVAHAAADQVGDVVELAQPVEDLERVGVDVAARDRMCLARDDDRARPSGQIISNRIGDIKPSGFSLVSAIMSHGVVPSRTCL